MDKAVKYISLAIIFFFISCFSYSQNAKSEEEVKKKASELFSNGEYSSALPLYSQLLSLYPKDPNYSYRFGACKLFAGKDKEAPLTYLEYGANDPSVEPEAYFFLAKAYHLNYRFDEALKMYRKFEETGVEKSKNRLSLKRHISMCENGKKLLKNITDIVVLEKKTLDRGDFFRNYNLAEFGGKIIKTPDEFKLAYDLKNKKESIMYLQPNAEVVYFSSYGPEGSNGKDIYFARKTPDGNWGKPQILQGPVNTESDEDYPFIHPNGTLYFSSTGHNSMGGYDVFQSTFDEATQQWSYPQNIDFAINTPGDDYLYITDMDEKNAYFSSTRESNENEVTVYRVKVDRIPVDIAIIKGNFISDATKSAKITIEDLKDGKIAGVYSTNANSGDYILTVPNGGKFKFIVETAESPVAYSGMVDIPRQKTLKALKQEMQLFADNGEQQLVIKNIFDEEVTDDISVLLAEIYKEKATLEVNADEIKEDTVTEEKTEQVAEVKKDSAVSSSSSETPVIKPELTVKTENISNEEIIKIAMDDAKSSQTEASDLRLETEIAYSIASEKNRMSSEKANEAEQFMTGALYSNEPSGKQQKLDRAKQLKKESKLYAEQAVAAYNLAREIEKTAAEKQKEADIALNYARELENAVSQNSPEATAEKLAQLNDFFEKQKSQPAEKTAYSDFQKQAEEKRKETEIQNKLAQKLADDVKSLEADISTLKTAAQAEKKKKDKERLEEQASLLERDLPSLQAEAQTAKETAEKTRKELVDLEKQESIISSVVSQIKSSGKTAVTNLNESDKSKLETEISSSEERIVKFEQEFASDTSSSEEPLVSVVSKDEKKEASGESPAVAKENETAGTNTVLPDYDSYFKEKVQAVETEADPIKKEESKAQDYENWANAIEKEAAELKQKSEQSADETEKTALREKAISLENSAKEKRELSVKSRQSAGQLRIAETTGESQVPDDYDSYFKEKAEAVEMVPDPVKKEETKAQNYENWAKAIEKEAVELKQKAGQSADETEKAALQEKVVMLENSAKEKQELSVKSRQSADQLRIAETTEENQVPEDYENYFKQKMESHEQQPNIVKKEEGKAQVYEGWARAIEKEAGELRRKADSATDETEKTALNEKAVSLENSAKEKRQMSQESQATAAQLRLSSPNTSETASSFSAGSTGIAPYSEKYISTEKKAMSIQNERDRAVTIAEINKEWADDISKEITAMQASADTTRDENKRADARETIRLLEELKKEKESKAQQYTEKALEAASLPDDKTSETSSAVAVNEAEIPADYNPWFEAKIKEQKEKSVTAENSSSEKEKIKSEETKAAYYESWANSIDKEIQELKKEEKTVVAEEEKRIIEEKISSREVQKNEKQALAQESKAEAKRLSSPGASGSENVSSEGTINISELPPAAQQMAAQIEAAKVKQLLMGDKKYKAESYSNLLKAIETSMENSKSLKEISSLESQSRELKQKIEVLNSEIEQEESAMAQEPVTEPAVKAADEKLTESVTAGQQADSLQSEAVYLNYQADKMGFFRKKKKEELQVKALSVQRESDLKKQDAGLASQSASALKSVKEDTRRAYENSSELSSEKELKKSGDAENEAAYLTDQASALRQNALNVKKKKEKKRLNAEADSLEHAAALKRKEAGHSRLLAEELKKLEREVFIDLVAEAEKKEERLPLSEKELSGEEAEELNQNEEQKRFTAHRKEYKKLYFEAEISNGESVKIKKESDVKLAQFSAMVSGIDTVGDAVARQQLVKDAMDFLEQTKKDIMKSDSIALVASFSEEAAGRKLREAVIPLLDGDKETMKKIFAYQYYQPPVDSAKLLALADTMPKDTIQPVPVPVEIQESFTLGGSAPVYNENNPIPLNPKYPDGLIWQVQIGAFRNPIPQDLFKGFAPIMGVKVSDGITRYSAGMFKTFAAANSARSEIVKLGYRDAFVVAYRDGQRISITDARALIAKGLFPADISVTPETTVASGTVSQESSAGEKPVSQIEGLFYTVQVGVYSKPATAKQLFNVQPVNSEKLSNGTIRYSSGIYKDFDSASEAKNKIVNIGIKDAFVTAYHNGKRISIAEAKGISGSGNPPPSAYENKQTNGEPGIVFKVQLGVYNGNVPTGDAGIILELSRKNEQIIRQDDGSTIYLAGAFSNFDEAEKLKNEAINKGLNGASVVAYNNGEKMDVDEARKSVKNNN